MSTEYRLPSLPFGGAEATIMRWLKQPGDRLAQGEPLLVAANDRVEVLLPATTSGILEAQLVAEGATTTAGAQIARLAPLSPDGVPARAPCRASPLARRIAAREKIDITDLTGTGPGDRILKSDVLAALAGREPRTKNQQPTTNNQELRTENLVIPGTENQEAGANVLDLEAQNSKLKTQNSKLEVPSRMRRAIAEHMVRSRATSPHAMTAMEVDMRQVAAERAQHRAAFARRGLELTYTACIALAAVAALPLHPLLNSSWSDAGIILRRRIHLGVAVALPVGLVTPIVRNAQDLNLHGIARAVGDLARRARAGALQPGETSGGTFTITNPGGGALWFGTPIISQPQSAILGVGAVQPRPQVISENGGDRIVARPIALLTLAYDARVLDQAHADAFLSDVKYNLEHFRV